MKKYLDEDSSGHIGIKCTEVFYDWHYTNTNGEEYGYRSTTPSANRETASKIIYHEPLGAGDQHYADIFYEDGRVTRVFNLDAVNFVGIDNDRK